MGDRVAQEAAYQKAANIADRLLADGVPLLGFDQFDMGHKLGFLFQLTGERAKYGCRVETETATPESVRALYEAVR